MAPTLRAGDALIVRRGGRVRAGDVVVARFRSRPDLLVVKRAVREQDGGWWVQGDNSLSGTTPGRTGWRMSSAVCYFATTRARVG